MHFYLTIPLYLPNITFLYLCELPHPHTASVVSEVLQRTLAQWAKPSEKVLLIASDNGSNMIKAVKLMQKRELAEVKEKNEQHE